MTFMLDCEDASPDDLKSIKIAVVGAGAVGGFYGACLARDGYDVHFLMRKDLAHVKKHGLAIQSVKGDFKIAPAQVAGDTHQIGPCDLVLIALKTTANAALEKLIPPLLHKDTILMTLQNGLGNEDFLGERFGAERVMGCLCFTCLNRTKPGLVVHSSNGQVVIGEYQRAPTARSRNLAGIFEKMGFLGRISKSLEKARWKKLVWNVPFNGLAIAGGGIDVAKILANDDLREETRALMQEIIEAAEKFGHIMPRGFAERNIRVSYDMGTYKPSSLIDFLDKREVEIEAIWGEPWRQATARGAQLPRTGMLYHLLKSLVQNHKNADQ